MDDRRLLILHPGALGDVVVAFPLFEAFRKDFQAIELLCQGGIGDLAVHLGVVDRCLPVEGARYGALYQDRIEDADLVKQLAGYHQILLISRSELPERAVRTATDVPVVRIPPRPPLGRRVHVFDFLRSELREKNFATEGLPCLPRRSGGRNGPVFLHPGSGSPRKNWPLDRFLSVFQWLKARGCAPEFIVGPAERELADRIGKDAPVRVPRNLPELADLLVDARGFIGNDSGVGHLAAYLNVPTLAIFGPSDPVRWRPKGGRTAVLGGDAPDCFRCFESAERLHCHRRECLERIFPEQVVRAFEALVDSKG